MMQIPESIKMMIYSYIITPSAFCIKEEIARCLSILDQTSFNDSQTIWTVMTIDWYDYYKIYNYGYEYFKNTSSLFRYDLMIAKQIHVSNLYNIDINEGTLNMIQINKGRVENESKICNLKDIYQKEFFKWIEYIKWWETK